MCPPCAQTLHVVAESGGIERNGMGRIFSAILRRYWASTRPAKGLKITWGRLWPRLSRVRSPSLTLRLGARCQRRSRHNIDQVAAPRPTSWGPSARPVRSPSLTLRVGSSRAVWMTEHSTAAQVTTRL